MSRLRKAALAAAGVVALAAQVTRADPADFTGFTWRDPLSADSRFIHKVNVDVVLSSGCMTGACIGWNAAEAVDLRNITDSSKLWLFLAGFGKGNQPTADNMIPWDEFWAAGPALIFHEGDELACSPMIEDVNYPQMTIWNDCGKIEMAAWVAGFIEGYRDYQSEHPLAEVPDPGYMFFDNEVAITSQPFSYEHEVLRILHAQLNCDPRADSHDYEIDGFPGKTLVELYEDAGSPPFNYSLTPFQSDNNRIAIAWYEGIGNRAREAAMQEVVYGPLYDEFGAICSDYDSSVKLDGETAVDYRDARKFYGQCGAGAYPYAPFWEGEGQAQGPVLYGLDPYYWNPMETYYWGTDPDTVVLEHHRRYLTACQRSFVNTESWDNIIPWITLPNYDIPGDACFDDYIFGHDPDAMTPDLAALRLMALLRGKHINKAIIWTNPATDEEEQWIDMKEVIDWAWIADTSAYSVLIGTPGGGYTDTGFFSNDAALAVDATLQQTGGYVVEVIVEFDTLFTSTSSPVTMEVNTETWLGSSTSAVSGEIKAFDWTPGPGAWGSTPVGTFTCSGTREAPTNTYHQAAVAEYVESTSKDVKLKLKFTSANDFVVKIDMVQLYKCKE